jgi:hypothetical protein
MTCAAVADADCFYPFRPMVAVPPATSQRSCRCPRNVGADAIEGDHVVVVALGLGVWFWVS